MTNLQKGAPVLSARSLKRLWIGVPAAALGILALAMTAAVLTPMLQTLQKDISRLRELEDLQVQVSLMRQQLRAQDGQQEKALQQREKLFRMIAGSGDVSTLLAVLDREARASGVQLDLYEPQAGGAPPPPAGQAAPPAGANQAPQPSPLEMAGLQPMGMLISLRGPYPNLLAFLRRLESLNVLVIQSDLRLEAPPPSTDPAKPTAAVVTMKLSLRVYGKAGGAEAPPAAAPAAGTPPGNATPPAASPGAPATPARPGNAPPANTPAGTPAPAQGGAAPPAATPAAGAPAAGR